MSLQYLCFDDLYTTTVEGGKTRKLSFDIIEKFTCKVLRIILIIKEDLTFFQHSLFNMKMRKTVALTNSYDKSYLSTDLHVKIYQYYISFGYCI